MLLPKKIVSHVISKIPEYNQLLSLLCKTVKWAKVRNSLFIEYLYILVFIRIFIGCVNNSDIQLS